MNCERILRVTNCFLLCSGYQLHSFEPKTRRYRFSFWGLTNFILLALLYGICFNHHFEISPLLQLMQDVSPFLRRLVRVQLWLGLKILFFGLYEQKWVVRGANDLAKILPRVYAHKFSRDEIVAYVLLFSTFIISLGFIFYIAYEMKFKLPPQDHILVALALFMPHFILAGALRFYLVGSWLLRQQLQNLECDMEALLAERKSQHQFIAGVEVTNTSLELEPSLKQMYLQLEVLASTQKAFSQALRRQLLLLIFLNSNCLLAGVYGAIYFESAWHVIFSEPSQRIFHAANLGIFVFIFSDYMCLCWMRVSYAKVKNIFYRKLFVFLKERLRFSKAARVLLKDMRDLLLREFNFRLLGTRNIHVWIFLLLQILIALLIALIVIYHYLTDQIVSLSSRLDEADAEED